MAKKTAAAPKKVAAKAKVKAAPVPRGPRKDYSLVRIIKLPAENWRRAGTANHTRAKEVMAYMKRRPQATVADLFAATTYRPQDFQWDLEREIFKTANVSPKAAKASPAKRKAANGVAEGASA